MLGLRSFACEQCETVSADPAVPSACPRCGATLLTELTEWRGAATYFTDGE